MVRNGKNGGLHLKQISYYKLTGGYHPTTLASERSGIRRAAKKFVFKDNKLFYVGKNKGQMRLVILSNEEKRNVLENCHENHEGGHHDISRTLTLVESQYYWTSITSDVKQWVSACQHCLLARNTAITASKFPTVKAKDPWTILIVDLLGPFKVTSKNNMYVILLTDVFTKWAVALPLLELSSAEVAKAIVSVSFCYGPPQKIAIDQRKEFIQQINCELFDLLGTKELLMSYPQTDCKNEIGKTIRSFLLRYCTENSKDWDDHLQAIAYAFNLIPSEDNQSTPYFEMFKRNPCMPFSEIQEGRNDCMFDRIVTAIKQVQKTVQEITATNCLDLKKMHVEEQKVNKGSVRKKPKHLNPPLKVGHEVFRQRKNWWKDGRFQSECVGPCIIDCITDNGCAILRNAAGSKLKRPIKISHLKPYIRGSHKQDNSPVWPSTVVADYDYAGSAKAATEQGSKVAYSPKGLPPLVPDDALLDKDLLLSGCEHDAQPECTKPDSTESATVNSDHWSTTYWTIQNKSRAI
nr:PREDICTED: gypsy retrotransposon integrase-like protein 1 isoform X1 [Anolis carolinensis]XP_008112195.1 PREDICTED: gypsy retrotransposon integrase-like protein 1 isoform X1 [Anolis carolinensis]|eukprot:XP_008112192.1 PREDICTED: gypsy retrotransposon integrase-like protein 1 isoform X1 [Anolis carolinensis]